MTLKDPPRNPREWTVNHHKRLILTKTINFPWEIKNFIRNRKKKSLLWLRRTHCKLYPEPTTSRKNLSVWKSLAWTPRKLLYYRGSWITRGLDKQGSVKKHEHWYIFINNLDVLKKSRKGLRELPTMEFRWV